VIHVVSPKARLLAENHGHAFSVSVAPDEAGLVWGDYSTLQRLLWILVDNAAKYTVQPGSIGISLEVSHGVVTLAVKDTGIGISASDLPHIFDRFYRADRSRGCVEGSGLGLAIARWIIDIHQAEVTVQSREQEGTVFRIAFPAYSGANAGLASTVAAT
jgi:signal transduction histidine kinase